MRSEPDAGAPPPTVLDGGMATELQRRGISVSPPWWTSAALRTPSGRQALREVHTSYGAAGADVLTANTFRTNRRALDRAGVSPREAVRFVADAVADARSAARTVDRPVRIAASVAPVEDCYRPDLVPDDADLRAEHAWHVAALADAGADLVLVETMCTIREAVVAVEAATARNLPAFASFVCGDGGRLLSGEPIDAAARRVQDAGATAVLINCTTPARCTAALEVLAGTCGVPIGVYPNVEDRSELPENTPVDRYVPVAYGVGQYVDTVAEWLARYPLTFVGGCCGSTPEHIRAVADLVRTPVHP
jgi:enediyne biosynthesis protein CalE2